MITKPLTRTAILTAGLLATFSPAWAAENSLRLENPRIVVEIDRESGAIHSIHDKKQDAVYPQTGIGFEVVTKKGTFLSKKATAVSAKAGQVELRFTGNGLNITLHYRLGAKDHFIEKWLEIKSADGKPYFLKSVALEDLTTEAFEEIHFHDDNTIWHCPINLFLRGEKGGCFAGLAYPYWDLEQKGTDGFRLGYKPSYQAAAKEVNVSEKYFIGVYRKEGIHRYSQGPYPGATASPYMGFGGSGLAQHFKGRIPKAAVKSEILDWGEVWAMQEFMLHALPYDLGLPEKGYWVWQNGWWAKLWDIKPAILDQLKQAGIHDIMTAHTWYGRGVHPLSPPYIDQMRTKPWGFPQDSGVAGMPGPAGPTAGLHADHAKVKLDKFSPGKFTPKFSAPPAMEAFHAYGQKIGVNVSSFTLPIVYFKDHPEWGALDENGKVNEYLFGRKLSCPGCDDYMDHMLEVVDHVITKYNARWWGFDGRWLSYWEVPKYRPGPKGLGFDLCYAKNHGHLPGDNLYKEWKNIEKFLRELRRRHPEMCLEQYYGMKRGGPWAMRYFNADENYYETNGVIMNRFQAWHNGNDRFRPVYKNMSAVIGKSVKDFRNSLLTTISVTSYAKFGEGFYGLALEENRTFLKTWRAWATENHDYLKVKRDLFDCPGFKPIDGSAHIIKDRGFIFLFSNNHNGNPARASIPINRWIQLEENPKAVYQIKEVYPNKGKVLATVRYGEDFLYDMPKNSAVVLEIEPAPSGSKPSPAMTGNPQKNVQIIRAFSSAAPAKSKKATYWHWPFDALTENGTSTPDTSPNKLHAQLSGQELGDGVVGKALQFKTGGKGVVVGNLDFQAPATVSFWLKSNGEQADGRIFSQLEGETTQSGSFRLAGSTLQVWNAKGWPVAVDGLNNKGIWQHVALVYKADGTVTGYLNGKKAHTVESGFNFYSGKAGICTPFLGKWGSPFVGALDDFRVSNRALKEKGIKAMVPPELLKKTEATAAKTTTPKPVTKSSGEPAKDQYRIALRPGVPGKAPFWNVGSRRFMYAPAFNFKVIAGADRYRFQAKASDGKTHTFEAKEPYATLAPVWLKIPTGSVHLKVEALNDKGGVIGLSGARSFQRTPMYNGPYLKQIKDYQQSAQEGLNTLFKRRYFVEWMKPGVKASDYRRTGDDYKHAGAAYPAKLIGAVVAGSALYAQITPRPDDADKVIAIGRKAADYLISLSFPAGTPVEHFPPTYDKRRDVMMNYPAEAAMAYLDFYEVTKEKKYLDAAVKVAQTYQKLQLPNGTWSTVIRPTGKGHGPSMLNGVEPVRLFERLMEQYGHKEFKEMRDKAFAYLMAHPMKTYMWTSQFEDGPPNHSYKALSPAQACELSMYLFDHRKDNPRYVDQAIELMRWSEDQFVTWEVPGNPKFLGHSWLKIPCVMEQYGYMVPVNFSSQHLIDTYIKAWQSTGNKLYIAKAKDLANGLLHAQEKHQGEYPTYLLSPSADGSFEFTQNIWINCGVYTIRSVMHLSDALKSEKGKK